ncbi:MAG TPA: hypothetical protein VK837_08685 [Longimicrobiales bacterium]|nr:hypothetical protein [Longimicrobiales bacterium]
MHEPTPREKALTQFPAVYLTLVSVVQAIALEVLVARVVAVRPAFALSADAVIVWLEVVLLVLTIFYGWVSYTLLVTLAQWVLRAFDFAAAFSVGLMQFVAIGFIGPGSFTAFCSMVAVGFGFGAFVSHSNTGVAARRPENLTVMRSMPRRRLTFLLGLVGLSGVAGALAAGTSRALVVAALAACNLILVAALREWFAWWNRVVRE